MVNPDSEQRMITEMAELAKTFGNEHRLRLLELVAQGPRTVDRLAEMSGLSIANASQHLKTLYRAGLVTSQREGKYIRYSLSELPVFNALSALRQVIEGKHDAMRAVADSALNDRSRLELVTRSELADRIRAKDVVLLDVRPPEEYAEGHLPGALNIPFDYLEARLSELPEGIEIVAYCRGPYCVMSFDAVDLLKARNFQARRFEEGFPEWKAAGLRVETRH